MIVPSRELLPIICAALERGQRVRMTVNGFSMLPFIHNNDTVELESLHALPQFGDIVLAQGTGGHYVIHRVVRAKGEIFYLRGDAQTHCEGPLALDNILGKVIESNRRGQVRNHTRGAWCFLGLIWGYSNPLGFYLLQSALWLRRIGGKALRRLQLIS